MSSVKPLKNRGQKRSFLSRFLPRFFVQNHNILCFSSLFLLFTTKRHLNHDFNMRGDGTRILHGKSYCSKLSPPFAGEYKVHLLYPTGRFSPLFSGFHPFSGSTIPSIHFGKTIAQFVSPLSMSLSHLGTIGTFFPARISFIISSVSSCRQNLLRM